MNQLFRQTAQAMFAMTALVNIYAQLQPAGALDAVSKILLMPCLALIFISSASRRSGSVFYILLTALFFSWLGDVFLLYEPSLPALFIPGLVAFLITHLIYIYLFRRMRYPALNTPPRAFIFSRIVFLVFVGSFLYTLLFARLGEMTLPVAFYTVVIIAMAIMALLRKERTTEKSFLLVYGGALLFVLSDALLAIDRFHSPVQLGPALIMASYILAQYLIVSGILDHVAGSAPQERS